MANSTKEMADSSKKWPIPSASAESARGISQFKIATFSRLSGISKIQEDNEARHHITTLPRNELLCQLFRGHR